MRRPGPTSPASPSCAGAAMTIAFLRVPIDLPRPHCLLSWSFWDFPADCLGTKTVRISPRASRAQRATGRADRGRQTCARRFSPATHLALDGLDEPQGGEAPAKRRLVEGVAQHRLAHRLHLAERERQREETGLQRQVRHHEACDLDSACNRARVFEVASAAALRFQAGSHRGVQRPCRRSTVTSANLSSWMRRTRSTAPAPCATRYPSAVFSIT